MSSLDALSTTARDDLARTARKWWVTALVFAASATGFLFGYQMLNDHFTRLARAREIVAYGEAPFRDFFDPGYFLSLYASAAMQRATGHVLLADLILDITFLSIGATLVFSMTTDFMKSVRWGLVATALVILGQPRSYDFDKVCFFPLGAWVCWQYAKNPTALRLVGISATAVAAGLFRYDNAVFIAIAASTTIVSRHWGEWRTVASRMALAGVVAAALLLPALGFVAKTAGLAAVADQMTSYARSGATRGSLFHPTRVSVVTSAPLLIVGSPVWRSQILPGYLTRPNAAAWMFYLALALPVIGAIGLIARRREVTRAEVSTTLGIAALLLVLALFVLKEPVEAHVGAVLPIAVLSSALAFGGARDGALRRSIGLVAATVGVVSLIGLATLFDRPPIRNLNVVQRLSRFAEEPPSLDLMPDTRYASLVRYLRQCTTATDRIFVGWFAPEIFVFSERGFAGRLAGVFGEYWSQEPYQQMAIDQLRQQSVPIVITLKNTELDKSHRLLWQYIAGEYELVEGAEQDDMPLTGIWARRGLRVEGWYGRTPLPCYAR